MPPYLAGRESARIKLTGPASVGGMALEKLGRRPLPVLARAA